mmetsp:Transcript_24988/g.55441  ORF Transcript_24988/g.55441 Transcript_24988/m.55441 type:complete len:217 (+) Transcript_24988:481-1131(+)
MAMGSAYPLPSTKRLFFFSKARATRLHLSLVRRAMPKEMGRRCRESSSSLFSAGSLSPSLSSFSCRNQSASRDSTVTCVEKALVEATAFSRPAFRYTPRPVVREMSEPTTFTTEMQGTPTSSPIFTARCTSLVSPDCDTASSAPAFFGMSLRRISAASSTDTVSKQSRSRMILAPSSAACREVPQPVSSRLLILAICSAFLSIPPSTTRFPFMRAP